MKNPLLKEIAKIKDEKLRAEIMDYVEKNKHLYATQPAAHTYHHAYEGGLLAHIREIIEICELFAGKYDNINLDYMIAAAIMHDAEKLWKYLPPHSGEDRPPYHAKIRHEIFPMIDYVVQTGHVLPPGVQIMILTHMGGFSRIDMPPSSRESVMFASADFISAYLEHDTLQRHL